jgi:DNA-binding response OmpR family regulator
LFAFVTFISYIAKLDITKPKIMRKVRTIILEDNQIEQGILKYLLIARNHEVITYNDPSICPLQLSPECRCSEDERCTDIIISDLNMPYVNGLEYIRNQRIKGCKCKKVALVSSELNEDVKKKAEELSCKVFAKPYDISEIYNWLDDVESTMDQEIKLSNWFEC